MTETTDDPTTTHELDAPPWLRVETTLMATAGLIRDAFDCRLQPLSLNLTQASLLSYVAEFGPVSQRQVADHLGHGRAATGASIDRLEKRGLLRRSPDPDDRRVWLIAVTEDGARCTEAVREIDEILRAELRQGIDRAERQALASLMTRLQHNLRTAIRNTQ